MTYIIVGIILPAVIIALALLSLFLTGATKPKYTPPPDKDSDSDKAE